MKQLLKFRMAAALTAAALAGSAQAVPTLTLNDGQGHSVSVTDGGGGDANPALGAVSWIGALGNWFLNVSTGVSKPALGSPTNPTLDLNSIDAVNSLGGTLTITFSESGFIRNGVALASIGGTTDGSVLFNTFVNGNPLTSQVFHGNPFAGAAAGVVNQNGPYTLSEQLVITQRGKGITSFNAGLHVPDGGLTAALLGFVLVAIEGARRRASR